MYFVLHDDLDVFDVEARRRLTGITADGWSGYCLSMTRSHILL